MSSATWRQFCLGVNVIIYTVATIYIPAFDKIIQWTSTPNIQCAMCAFSRYGYYAHSCHIGHIGLVLSIDKVAGLILGLNPANERRRYQVTTSLIG